MQREDKLKIIKEQSLRKQALLDEHGFRQRFPCAQFQLSSCSLLVLRADGSFYRVSDSELAQMIDGKKPMPPGEESAIREWYERSGYRFGHEESKLIVSAEEAIREEDLLRFGAADQALQRLAGEHQGRDPKTARLRELRELYREDGERLEQLYTIMYGEEKRLRFGSVRLVITDALTDEQGYERSEGFFEDLAAAYGCMERVRALPDYSPSTGLIYTAEHVTGEGRGVIRVGSEEIGLEAMLTREGLTETSSCMVYVEPLQLDEARLHRLARIHLPEYDLPASAFSFLAHKDRVTLVVDGSAYLVGDPHVLAQEMPRVLERVILPSRVGARSH